MRGNNERHARRTFLRAAGTAVGVGTVLSTASGTVAASPSTTYDNDGGLDEARQVIGTSDGGYLIAGNSTASPGSGDGPDAWVVKADARGRVVWDRTYGESGSAIEPAGVVEVTGAGGRSRGYLLAGTHRRPNGASTLWVARLRARDGHLRWSRRYGSSDPRVVGREASRSGAVNLSGTVLDFGEPAIVQSGPPSARRFTVVGTEELSTGSTPSSATTPRAFAIQMDGSGHAIWERAYGRDPETSNTGVAITRAPGGFAVVGECDGAYWLVKLDDSGNRRWARAYPLPERSMEDDEPPYFGGVSPTAIVRADDGGYVLDGTVTHSWIDLGAYVIGYSIPYLVRTDGDGRPRATGAASAPMFQYFTAGALVEATADRYAVFGSRLRDNPFDEDSRENANFVLTVFDGDLNVVSQTKYDHSDYDDDFGTSIAKTNDGYLLAGTSRHDYWVETLDSLP